MNGLDNPHGPTTKGAANGRDGLDVQLTWAPHQPGTTTSCGGTCLPYERSTSLNCPLGISDLTLFTLGFSVSMEERKLFSLSEVSLHTAKNDCWLIIGGKVYDVTKFLEEHPGGDDVLIQASANGDATQAFEEVGHSSTATAMMSSYLIGVLEGSDSLDDDVGGPHQKQQEGGFVTAKTVQEKKPPSASSGLMDFLVPLLIVAIALGAWYFYNRSQL